jgi:hypothetical protein
MLTYGQYETRFTHSTAWSSRHLAYRFGAKYQSVSPPAVVAAAVRLSMLAHAGVPGSSQGQWHSISPAELMAQGLPMSRCALYTLTKHPDFRVHFVAHSAQQHVVALNPLEYAYCRRPDESYVQFHEAARNIVKANTIAAHAIGEVAAFMALGRLDHAQDKDRMLFDIDRAAQFARLARTRSFDELLADNGKLLVQYHAQAAGMDVKASREARSRAYKSREVTSSESVEHRAVG